MKRITAVLLAVLCMTALFGCAKKSDLGEGAETNADGTVKETKNEEMYNFLVMGHDRQASLTDVVMLVSYDTAEDKMTVMQLPRDTYIEVDDYSYHKLNGLYNHCVAEADEDGSEDPELDGATRAAKYLGKALGIKIHYSFVMDLDGFGAIVDAVGGVYMYVPYTMEYDDPKQNLYINLPEGYNTLDGDEAEQFVRYRSGFATGDLGRGDAQKMFMTAFIEAVKNNITVSSVGEIANAILSNVKTDISVGTLVKFATDFISIELSDITMLTMPGEACMSGGASYYVMNKECVTEVLAESYNIYVDELTADSVDPDSIFCNESDPAMAAVYDKPADELSYKKYNAQDVSDEDIEIY